MEQVRFYHGTGWRQIVSRLYAAASSLGVYSTDAARSTRSLPLHKPFPTYNPYHGSWHEGLRAWNVHPEG